MSYLHPASKIKVPQADLTPTISLPNVAKEELINPNGILVGGKVEGEERRFSQYLTEAQLT